jgi:hypothetical protein
MTHPRKRNGLVKFLRKVEGKETEDVKDHIPPQERLGRRLYERYKCLFELLSGSCSYSDLIYWYLGLNPEERQVVTAIRDSIVGPGYTFNAYQVGDNNSKQRAIDTAVECILRHSGSEQQDDVQEVASGQSAGVSPYYSYSLYSSRPSFRYTVGTTPGSSFSGEEPVRNYWGRTIRYGPE